MAEIFLHCPSCGRLVRRERAPHNRGTVICPHCLLLRGRKVALEDEARPLEVQLETVAEDDDV